MTPARAAAPGDEAAAALQGVASAQGRRALLIAVAVGCLGAVLLALYLHRFELEVSGGKRVQLLTPLRHIERGELIAEDMLSVIEVPAAYVDPRAIKAAERRKIIGIKAATALDPQLTLLWSDLAIAVEDRDLSSLIQPGSRAVTVEANQGLGRGTAGHGLIRPGDYVDVIATLQADRGGELASVVLLQRVLVLAVNSETQPQAFAEGSERGSRNERRAELTLSLRLEQVQLLSLARERGSLSVVLRNPDDDQVIQGVPDLPAAGLFDTALRARAQRTDAARGAASGHVPTRITAAERR